MPGIAVSGRSNLMAVDTGAGASRQAPEGLVTVRSAFPARTTLDRLVREVESRGLTVFCRIDHAGNALEAGLSLRPTEVLIFGNARGGTPLMAMRQTLGIDLPLKALAWEDSAGQAWLSYYDPAWLAARHGLVGMDPPPTAALSALLAAVTKAAAMP
jgi:uncharacterized protein (DUF302 family)